MGISIGAIICVFKVFQAISVIRYIGRTLPLIDKHAEEVQVGLDYANACNESFSESGEELEKPMREESKFQRERFCVHNVLRTLLVTFTVLTFVGFVLAVARFVMMHFCEDS